jgi:hypothetical protein
VSAPLRTARWLVAGLLGAVFTFAPLDDARAESMDPTLSRLVLDGRCNPGGRINDGDAFGDSVSDPGADGTPDRQQIAEYYQSLGLPTRDGLCAPDNAAWKKLISEWGFAIAPNATHTARTTGYGGFHFSLQASYTKINSGASYWKLGTQGNRDPSSGAASVSGDPAGVITQYSLAARKSFGFGLETTLALGFMPNTSIIVGGSDVRLAILEGFRTGVLGVFPDLAVGGGVRTITGTSEFQLTTVGLDVVLSKGLAIGESSILSPWIGYQYLWMFGDSGLIDMTPGTDALGYCGFTGVNVPGNADPSKTVYDGQPVCAGGSPLDFNNHAVFEQARLERQRLSVGLNYSYEMVTGAAQFITDFMDPADAQNSDQDKERLSNCDAAGENCKSIPRQWTLALELGVKF